MKSRMALIVAIILGSVATLGVYAVIQQAKQDSAAAQTKEKVAFAKTELASGDTLVADMIEWKEVPSNYISKDNILQRDKDIFFTKKLTSKVSQDAPIMRTYFQIGAVDISVEKPAQGYRAISVPIEYHQGVSGLLRPGQRVDIIGTFDIRVALLYIQGEDGKLRPPSEEEISAAWGTPPPSAPGGKPRKAQKDDLGGNMLFFFFYWATTEFYTEDMYDYWRITNFKGMDKQIVTYTLVQNAVVLAVDSATETTVNTLLGSYEAITVQVTPEQAQMVAFGIKAGELTFSLRNKDDVEAVRAAPEYIEKMLAPRHQSGPRSIVSDLENE